MASYKWLNADHTEVLATDDSGHIKTVPAILDNQDYAKIVSDGVAISDFVAPLIFSSGITLAGKVRTTNAAVTEIFRATLVLNTGYTGTATVIGVDAGNGNVKVVLASIAAKRLASGAIQIGAPVRMNPGQEDTGTSTWVVNAIVSGNDWVVTVQGANGRTIDWQLFGTVVSFTPGGA